MKHNMSENLRKFRLKPKKKDDFQVKHNPKWHKMKQNFLSYWGKKLDERLKATMQCFTTEKKKKRESTEVH